MLEGLLHFGFSQVASLKLRNSSPVADPDELAAKRYRCAPLCVTKFRSRKESGGFRLV